MAFLGQTLGLRKKMVVNANLGGIREGVFILEYDTLNTGCLKKCGPFENAIMPSFMKESFPNFMWL